MAMLAVVVAVVMMVIFISEEPLFILLYICGSSRPVPPIPLPKFQHHGLYKTMGNSIDSASCVIKKNCTSHNKDTDIDAYC